MNEETHWRNTPRVSSVEYVKTVTRAIRESGLSLEYKHLTTLQDKMFEEIHLPRLRVFQILNKMQEARDAGQDQITLDIEDVNIMLRAAREFK